MVAYRVARATEIKELTASVTVRREDDAKGIISGSAGVVGALRREAAAV